MKQKNDRAAKPSVSVTVTEGGGLLECARRELKGWSAGKVKSCLEHRQISVDGQVCTQFDAPVKAGQRITVAPKGAAVHLPMPVLYEDDSLLVVDKPAGLLVVATEQEKSRTAIRMLRDAGVSPLYVVHRLDRDTSGVLVFAKSQPVRDALQQNWDSVKRQYIAVCEGVFEEKSGHCDTLLTENVNHVVYSSPNGGKRAITDYEVVSDNGLYSLLHITISTGRKNQIRVHMKELGHPVVGDKKYGSGAGPLGRLALHSSLLGLRHPVTGEYLELKAPMPAKLRLKNLPSADQ